MTTTEAYRSHVDSVLLIDMAFLQGTSFQARERIICCTSFSHCAALDEQCLLLKESILNETEEFCMVQSADRFALSCGTQHYLPANISHILPMRLRFYIKKLLFLNLNLTVNVQLANDQGS